MVHDWVPSYRYAFSFNGVSWSISAEMFFYLAFPFLIVRRERIIIGFLASLVVILALLYISRDLKLDRAMPIHERSAFLVWAHLHPTASIVGFILGMLGASIFRSMQSLKLNPITGTVVECAAIILCIWWFWKGSVLMYPRSLSDVGRVYYSYNSAFLVAPIIVFIFAWNSGLFSNILSWQPLVVLGKISFSTYMLHQILIRSAMHYALPTKIGQFNAVFLTILVAYLGSWLLWRMVEEPMRHKLTDAYRYITTRRTPINLGNAPSSLGKELS